MSEKIVHPSEPWPELTSTEKRNPQTGAYEPVKAAPLLEDDAELVARLLNPAPPGTVTYGPCYHPAGEAASRLQSRSGALVRVLAECDEDDDAKEQELLAVAPYEIEPARRHHLQMINEIRRLVGEK